MNPTCSKHYTIHLNENLMIEKFNLFRCYVSLIAWHEYTLRILARESG